MNNLVATPQTSRSRVLFVPRVQPVVERNSIVPPVAGRVTIRPMVALPDSNATITMSEISYRLKVTPLAIFKWRHGSKERTPLPVIRYTLGRSYRYVIREKDLITWLSNNRSDLLERWKNGG